MVSAGFSCIVLGFPGLVVSFFLCADKGSRVFRVSHAESVFWRDGLVHDHLKRVDAWRVQVEMEVPVRGGERLGLVFACCQMEARFAPSSNTEASSSCTSRDLSLCMFLAQESEVFCSLP